MTATPPRGHQSSTFMLKCKRLKRREVLFNENIHVFSKLFVLCNPKLAKDLNTKLNYKINKPYEANSMYNTVFKP